MVTICVFKKLGKEVEDIDCASVQCTDCRKHCFCSQQFRLSYRLFRLHIHLSFGFAPPCIKHFNYTTIKTGMVNTQYWIYILSNRLFNGNIKKKNYSIKLMSTYKFITYGGLINLDFITEKPLFSALYDLDVGWVAFVRKLNW